MSGFGLLGGLDDDTQAKDSSNSKGPHKGVSLPAPPSSFGLGGEINHEPGTKPPSSALPSKPPAPSFGLGSEFTEPVAPPSARPPIHHHQQQQPGTSFGLGSEISAAPANVHPPPAAKPHPPRAAYPSDALLTLDAKPSRPTPSSSYGLSSEIEPASPATSATLKTPTRKAGLGLHQQQQQQQQQQKVPPASQPFGLGSELGAAAAAPPAPLRGLGSLPLGGSAAPAAQPGHSFGLGSEATKKGTATDGGAQMSNLRGGAGVPAASAASASAPPPSFGLGSEMRGAGLPTTPSRRPPVQTTQVQAPLSSQLDAVRQGRDQQQGVVRCVCARVCVRVCVCACMCVCKE